MQKSVPKCGPRCIIWPLYDPQQNERTIHMSKVIFLVCVFVVAVALLACSKPESSTNRSATAPATAPAASPVASAPTTVASGEKIGVPECDQFLTAYESCITGKVPAAARAQYNTAIAQWRSSWKKLAETPQAKATLPGICKTQLDSAKTAMKSFGCTF